MRALKLFGNSFSWASTRAYPAAYALIFRYCVFAARFLYSLSWASSSALAASDTGLFVYYICHNNLNLS
jgi:hypothetical protein